MATELLPDPFQTTLAAAIGGASVGASTTITLADTSWITGSLSFASGTSEFFAYIGNPRLPASMEVVKVTQTSPSIIVTRGADGRTPVSHDITHQFGPALRGTAIQDLIDQTVGSPTFSGVVRFTGVITPTALAANQNDWNPTGLATANVIRASASAAYNLTGIVAQELGREFRLENVGSFNITLKDADTGSAAANRFDLTTDYVLLPGAFVVLKYDGTTQRWRGTPSVNGVIFQNFGTDVQHAPRVNVIGDFLSATYNAGDNAIDLEQFQPDLGSLDGIDEDPRILKAPVRVASTGNVTVSSPGASIDGVALASFNEVLLKDQTAPEENGIYRWNGAAVAMTRASQSNTAAELPTGFLVYVKEGTANAGKVFVHTTTAAITLGTTALTFEEAGGGGGGGLSNHDHSAPTTEGGSTLNPASVTASGPVTAASLWGTDGPFAAGYDLTPAQITADVDDYAPAGIDACFQVNLDTDASHELRGLVNEGDNHMLALVNVGANDLVLVHEAGTSTAGNRFHLPGAANLTLTAGHAALIRYKSSTNRWRVIASTLTGAGGGMTSFDLDGDTGTAETVSDGETVIVAGGTGLSSAVAATNTVTVNLDIDSLAADASPDGANDYVATWDDSAGTHKKVLLDDLPGGGGGGAPTTATYVTETADGTLSNEVLLSTVNEQAAYGSLTAATRAGRLKFPTDGFTLLRDDGSTLDPYGPILPFTDPPAVAGFTWDNQGTATAADERGGILVTFPGTTTGNDVRGLYKTAPATPYTITISFLPTFTLGSFIRGFGTIFRQSSDGKIVIFALTNNSGATQLFHRKFTTSTAFSADYTGYTTNMLTLGPITHLQISDNGTNRITRYSVDGRNFVDVHSVTRTDFLTADQVGFAAWASTTGSDVSKVMLLNWTET